jgi:hypothetical protein
MAMSSRLSSAGFQTADLGVAGMRAMGESVRLDVADHLVAAPPRIGHRSLAGGELLRWPGQVHIAGMLQRGRETAESIGGSRSSPRSSGARRRRRRRAVAPASGRLPAAGRGEEGRGGVDSGHPASIPSTGRVVAARLSRRRPQRSSGMAGAAAIGVGRSCCKQLGFHPRVGSA